MFGNVFFTRRVLQAEIILRAETTNIFMDALGMLQKLSYERRNETGFHAKRCARARAMHNIHDVNSVTRFRRSVEAEGGRIY